MHKKSKLIVLCCGTFDLLHKGHKKYLEKSANLGELHVIVARDENVQRIKGFLPEENEQVRLNNVQNMKCVTSAVLGDKNDFLKKVQEINPDILALGYDQKLPLPIHLMQCVMPDLKITKISAYKAHKYKTSLLKSIQSTPQF